MGASRRQLITLAALSAVLVIVGIYRLSGSSGRPAAAAAVSIAPNVAGARRSVADIVMPSKDETWDLPTLEELQRLLVREWEPPANDPFVLPQRFRQAVSPSTTSAPPAAEPSTTAEPDERVVPPSFTVRSTYYVSGRWHAEINHRVYQTGDELDGYRIDWIGPDAIRVLFLGENEPAKALSRQWPSCVMRVGTEMMGILGGRWVVTGERAQEGVVRNIENRCITIEREVDEADGSRDRKTRLIEMRVDNGS